MPKRTETTFIDVIDTKCKTGPDTLRNVSLGINQELRPGVLNLLGNLSHNAEITLDRTNAKKLIKWLQENIVDVYEKPKAFYIIDQKGRPLSQFAQNDETGNNQLKFRSKDYISFSRRGEAQTHLNYILKHCTSGPASKLSITDTI